MKKIADTLFELMEKSFEMVLGIFLCLVFFAPLVWWWEGPSSDELVVYPATCSNQIKILPLEAFLHLGMPLDQASKKYDADRANCRILLLSRYTYKINRARGEVYFKSLVRTKRLVDCAIFSREDWTCSYRDGSGKVVIKDGLLVIQKHQLEVNRFYLRRWQWWFAKLYNWIDRPQGTWLIPEQQWAL